MIALIAAMDRNRVIGVDGRLPWRMPADLRYFRQRTMGHPIVMGRKTYASIGRALPGRTNVVVTRNPGYGAPGCDVVQSVEAALAAARGAPGGDVVFVIGGAEVYRQTIDAADTLYVTEIDTAVPRGDTFFPPIDPAKWMEVERTACPADAQNPFGYTFVTYVRRRR